MDAFEIQRKRLLYRSSHRGSKEMDMFLGSFAARHLAGMSEAELAAFETLLEENDIDLYTWLTGRETMPEDIAENPAMTLLINFKIKP